MSKYFTMGLLTMVLVLVGAGCGSDDDKTKTTNANSSYSNTNNVTDNEEEDEISNENEDAEEEENMDNENENINAEEEGSETQPTAAEITIEDMAFSEDTTVAAGVTVTVVNNDTVPHTVTADDGSFDTGLIDAGDSATFTAPETADEYTFTCTVHPDMTGTLTVE